uniref:BTB domain-containing protein n=2 Tax=Carnivora TaxID=33554 RepID=A0A8C0K585_CANLU
MPPPAEVTDPSHAPAVLRQLNEQRLRGLFCDVTLIAGDTKFPAHRSVLAASSPFFREALLASAPLPLPPVTGAPPTPPTPPPPTLPPPVPPKGEGERAGLERTQKGDVG